MSDVPGAALVAALLVGVAVLLLPGRPHLRRRAPVGAAGSAEPPPLDAALVLDLVAAVVESGAPPLSAVAAVARVLGEVGSPAAEHLAALASPPAPAAGGRPPPARLDRRSAGAVSALRAPLARCLELAEQTGAPVAVLLRSSADELRRGRRRAAALAAARLGVRVVAPLGLCTLPAFAALAVVPVLISLGRDLVSG